MRRLKPYLSMFRAKLMSLLQYRLPAAARFANDLFWGLVRAMFFSAFYAHATSLQPLTLTQTITYVWLGQLLAGVLPVGGDPDVMQMIRQGDVAYELCRPLDLYWQWFSRLIARKLAPLVLQAAPTALVVALLLPARYRMSAPASVPSLLAFVASLVAAAALSSAVANILGIVTIWTVSGDGIYRLAPALIMALCGLVIPLPLYPAGLQWLVNFLPFRGLMDTPARLYLGLAPPAAALGLLALQLAWTVALIGLGRLLLRRALRSLTVQGG